MMIKTTFTILVGLSMAVGSVNITAQAQGLKLKENSQMLTKRAIQPLTRQARLTARPKRSKDEVAASQDYTSECNLYGGGASTDPIGGETCTTPDGENIIVPFP